MNWIKILSKENHSNKKNCYFKANIDIRIMKVYIKIEVKLY